MKPSDRFSIPPQVVAREVGEQAMLFDMATGEPYNIDPIGARIWQLVEEGKTFGEVCDALIEEYEVARDELERDVTAYIGDLLDRKLMSTD